jgi:predicted TIM-barrel fold metal-dependent hydrolase
MYAQTRACLGQTDPYARLRDMDEAGIAADVIFAGGLNNDVLPFYSDTEFGSLSAVAAAVGTGLGGAGTADVPVALRTVGAHMWNRWMVDFVSAAPERLICAMQIPISNVAAAVDEVKWGRANGLRAVNFPAPRRDFPPYNDPVYEPLWDVCEDLQVPLLTHSSGGDWVPYPYASGVLMLISEVYWFSRRALSHLIFGGVFERHPGLKLVFTEQRVSWVPSELATLDSIYASVLHLDSEEVTVMPLPSAVESDVLGDLGASLPRTPSEYFASNCFIGASFLAPHEAALRDEVGVKNLLWGSDYPHPEGTWPDTRLAIRNALAAVPEDEARLILGENAVDVYNLDAEALRPIARRIGPKPSEVGQPLSENELPELRSLAFRVSGDQS